MKLARECQGLLNHPSWKQSIAPFPVNINTTPKQLLAVLNAGAKAINARTVGAVRADTLYIAETLWEFIMSQMQMSDVSAIPVLEYFLKNNPSIRNIGYLKELEGIGPNGEDGMFFYRRDPMVVKACITDPFRPRPLFRTSPTDWYRMYSLKYNGIKVYARGSGHLVYVPAA